MYCRAGCSICSFSGGGGTDFCCSCSCRTGMELVCNCCGGATRFLGVVVVGAFVDVVFRFLTAFGVEFRPFCTISATSCGNLSFGATTGFGGSGKGSQLCTKNAKRFPVSTG